MQDFTGMNLATEMENLFHEDIGNTDPDTLQFCLQLSDAEFWYCEPNQSNELLLPDAKGIERQIYEKYLGYPYELINDAKTDPEVSAFCRNKQLWLSGTINVNDIEEVERYDLLDSYGLDWDWFDEVERNQMICEIYFESNIYDFENN